MPLTCNHQTSLDQSNPLMATLTSFIAQFNDNSGNHLWTKERGSHKQWQYRGQVLAPKVKGSFLRTASLTLIILGFIPNKLLATPILAISVTDILNDTLGYDLAFSLSSSNLDFTKERSTKNENYSKNPNSH